jgi:hypothetical protein
MEQCMRAVWLIAAYILFALLVHDLMTARYVYVYCLTAGLALWVALMPAYIRPESAQKRPEQKQP